MIILFVSLICINLHKENGVTLAINLHFTKHQLSPLIYWCDTLRVAFSLTIFATLSGQIFSREKYFNLTVA